MQELAVTINASGASSYVWSGGITNGVAFVPASTNTYFVTGTDANGCTGTSARTVFVNPNLTPVLTITTPVTTICSGNLVTFTSTIVNGGTSPGYVWKVNGINTAFNTSTFFSYSLNNGDVVSCSHTSNETCLTTPYSNSNQITMTVNPLQTATIAITASASAICTGSNVTFIASAVNGGSTPVYIWKVNGVSAGTNSSTFSSSNLHNGDLVSCLLISNSTCVISNQVFSNIITMSVNPYLTPSIAITSNVPVSCAGNIVTFNATAVNGGSSPAYQWQVNGINAGNNSSTFLTSSLVNSDVVTCLLISNALCMTNATAASNPITMTVNAASVQASSITGNANNNEICLNDAVTLTVNGGSLGTGADWKWYTGTCNGSLIGTGATLNVSPSSVTSYYVKAEGFCNTTTCTQISIAVKTAPPANTITSVNAAAYACSGNSAAATCNAVSSVSSYIWDAPSGTFFDGGSSNPYTSSSGNVTVNYGTPNGSGYNICVQAANACGVTNRKCTWVRSIVSVPVSIIPGNSRTIECAGSTATYSVAAVTGASGYTWSVTGDGNRKW